MMDGTVQTLSALLVGDVMTPDAISVCATDTMAQVSETLRKHRITGAPVVDAFGQCVGVVSVTDFTHPPKGSHPGQTAEQQAAADEAVALDHVSAYMSSPAIYVSPRTPLLDAASMMTARHIHRLPVLNEKGLIAGMLSALDIVYVTVKAVASQRRVEQRSETACRN